MMGRKQTPFIWMPTRFQVYMRQADGTLYDSSRYVESVALEGNGTVLTVIVQLRPDAVEQALSADGGG
jgi:hypothetical protein